MRNILITGTSSGLGLGTAVALATRGERVFASMRDLSRSSDLEREAAKAGVELELVQLDVTDPESVTRAVDGVLAKAGPIDVLLNNAALATQGPLEFATDEEILRIFDANAFGPLRTIRAVLPSMRERGQGRILNVSSPGSNPRSGVRLWSLYTASKAALDAFTLDLCKEVAPLGIEVALVYAGGHTRMVEEAWVRAEALESEDSPSGQNPPRRRTGPRGPCRRAARGRVQSARRRLQHRSSPTPLPGFVCRVGGRADGRRRGVREACEARPGARTVRGHVGLLGRQPRRDRRWRLSPSV